jgi:hypothetical protein
MQAGQVDRGHGRRNRLIIGWLLWSIDAVGYFTVLFASSYGVNLFCTVGDDSSPAGSPFLSLWPFGPGCRSYADLPPSLKWTVVLLGLVGSGICLAVNSVTYRRSPARPDGDPHGESGPAESS